MIRNHLLRHQLVGRNQNLGVKDVWDSAYSNIGHPAI